MVCISKDLNVFLWKKEVEGEVEIERSIWLSPPSVYITGDSRKSLRQWTNWPTNRGEQSFYTWWQNRKQNYISTHSLMFILIFSVTFSFPWTSLIQIDIWDYNLKIFILDFFCPGIEKYWFMSFSWYWTTQLMLFHPSMLMSKWAHCVTMKHFTGAVCHLS